MTEGQALVEVQRELRDMEARAEQAEAALAKAINSRNEAELARHAAVKKGATARAVMAEESCVAVSKLDSTLLHANNCRDLKLVQRTLRALATLPAGLVVLPVEVVATVKKTLAGLDRCGGWNNHSWQDDGDRDNGKCSVCSMKSNDCRDVSEALSALDAAGGER